ncbi:MAG: hypothetical protein LLG97_06780 [Deltaproteobacteria bacterium]|nr:hypothetical protein [Deltaproteobacteria bacterium]
MKVSGRFAEDEMKHFEPEAKVGLIATVNPDGLPHITLITALQAKTPTELIWGQFSEGRSKEHVKGNPRTGFLILTLDRRLWRGKAVWTHERRSGEEFEMFNDKPMFRYNAYFGIHTVHYMDLHETEGQEALPLVRIAVASLLTRVVKSAARQGGDKPILKPWAQRLFNRLDALKFLCYVGGDGFPTLVPVLQCQAADSRRLVFSPLAFGRELKELRPGMPIAVLGLTMAMEDVLVRGAFAGFRRFRGVTLGALDIDWVYNSMPPRPGEIYPEEELRPVVNF